jgi:hypothetical protein
LANLIASGPSGRSPPSIAHSACSSRYAARPDCEEGVRAGGAQRADEKSEEQIPLVVIEQDEPVELAKPEYGEFPARGGGSAFIPCIRISFTAGFTVIE